VVPNAAPGNPSAAPAERVLSCSLVKGAARGSMKVVGTRAASPSGKLLAEPRTDSKTTGLASGQWKC
jgi:hypothetical protein